MSSWKAFRENPTFIRRKLCLKDHYVPEVNQSAPGKEHMKSFCKLCKMAQSNYPVFTNTLTRVLLTISLLVSFLEVSYSQFSNNDKTCAILYSGHEAQGQSFLLTDRDQSVNLEEDLRVSDEGWNVTNTIQVETGCQLQTCNETYFDGTCRSFEVGSYSFANFTERIASVQCVCEKQCKCADVFVKKSSCGRAYLQGGCSICHALYVNLNNESKYFPEEYASKVTAIKLRKGCTLTTYTDVEYDGDEKLIDRETTEDYNDDIGSYKCECDDDMYVPKPSPTRPSSYPDLIDIPNSMDEVIKMLSSDAYRNHPGLHAARTSYMNKRSSKNAYILLVGTTGAGKSSAINLLFDNPTVTKTGNESSTTTDIHEFRIPVAIDELGIANSELRVIDTPGLGDTRGLEQDAKFLATLDRFLSNHEELKDRLPNVVLIFHLFNDNRFKGEGSAFVKMIRGMDYFSKRITDEDYSNVIFVFSHFCSVPRKEKRRPEGRLASFKQVINDYTLYPKPLHLVVAENKPNDNELPMVNGYYKMPNNEYYPKNLFEKLELVTQKGGDVIGLGVFRTAFRDSENFNVTNSTFKLLTAKDGKVERFMSVLTNAIYGVVKTEVSQILDQAWNIHVDHELRKTFPFSLPYLQKALNLRNINTRQDIPKTTPEIVHLLMALKHDDATRTLLDKGLNIRSPAFPMNTVAGYSYNVFRDMPLTISPFQINSLQQSDIGFLIPTSLSCKVDQATKEHFGIFDSKEKYMENRLKSLGIQGTIPVDRFKGSIKPGSNLMELSIKEDSCTLSATRDFRLFEFILNDKLELTPEFQRTVRALPSYNETDVDNVEQWKQFFYTYGTHVVKSIYGGGAIAINLQSNKPFNQAFIETLFGLVKFAEEMTVLPLSNSDGNSSMSFITDGMEHSLTFIGGDSAFHTSDLTKLSIAEASNLLMNWKKSLKVNPAVLNTEMRLESISHVVKKLGQNYTEEIERATRLCFNAELKPVFMKKPEIGPGHDRPTTPMLMNMIQAIQQSNERFHNLTIEMKQSDQEAANKRLAMEREQNEWRRNQTIMDEEYRRKQEEIRRNDTIEDRKRQDDLMRKRLIHEENMAQRQREFNLAAEESRRAADKINADLLLAIMNKPAPKKQTCILFGLACW